MTVARGLLPRTRAAQNVLVLSITFGCAMAALFAYAFGVDRLTLAIASISLLAPATVGIIAAREQGILDPFAVFSLSYGAYNGLLLVRFCFLDEVEFPYPITVNQNTLMRAALLSTLGTCGIIATWLIFRRTGQVRTQRRGALQCKAAFITGLAFFIVALVLYFVQYHQLYGYFNAMGTDRGRSSK